MLLGGTGNQAASQAESLLSTHTTRHSRATGQADTCSRHYSTYIRFWPARSSRCRSSLVIEVMTGNLDHGHDRGHIRVSHRLTIPLDDNATFAFIY